MCLFDFRYNPWSSLPSQRRHHPRSDPTSNILVGDDGRAVLSDLSLGRLPVHHSRPEPETVVFRYQAPEVILDDPTSEASDVYSWAMTSLEIITGNPPFHAWRSPGQLVAQIITKGQIPSRSDYKSPVFDKYPEIWELFVRCWDREPNARPTAKEIAEALEKIPTTIEWDGRIDVTGQL